MHKTTGTFRLLVCTALASICLIGSCKLRTEKTSLKSTNLAPSAKVLDTIAKAAAHGRAVSQVIRADSNGPATTPVLLALGLASALERHFIGQQDLALVREFLARELPFLSNDFTDSNAFLTSCAETAAYARRHLEDLHNLRPGKEQSAFTPSPEIFNGTRTILDLLASLGSHAS